MDPDPKNAAPPPDDDALSTTSSMSFILAEEIDSIDSNAETASGDAQQEKVEVAVNPLMIQSQYAQVLFHEVEEFYENDSDLICNFTLYLTTSADSSTAKDVGNDIILKHREGDRVGIFRVPYIKPDEAIVFVTVEEENVVEGKGRVAFTKDEVPKEEDFYQFQYLRCEKTPEVLGASVPFQLKEKRKESTSVYQQKDEQETQTEGVKDVSDHLVHLSAENQRLEQSLNKANGDCARLLQLSENLTDQLEGRSLSFIELEKSLQFEKQNYQQLKMDVAFLVQEKIVLEQRFEKNNEELKKLRQEVDDISGKCQLKDREIALLKEEKEQVAAKLEDAKAIISAVKDSKLMAIKLLDEHVAKEQALKREVEELKAASACGRPSLESGTRSRWDRLEEKLHQLELSVSTTDEKYGKLVGGLSSDLSSLRSAIATRTPSVRSESVQSEIGGQSLELLNSTFIDGAVATTDNIETLRQKESNSFGQGGSSDPVQRQNSDVLPIPILPVQTVEAMAAAAKGGVESIKQFLTPFRHQTDPFGECRIEIEGPCQATTVIDRQPTAGCPEEECKKSEELIDEVKVSLGQKTVTIPDGKEDVGEEEAEGDDHSAGDNGETRAQAPERHERATGVVLTDDGRAITYSADGTVSCPICTKEFQHDQIRELEFHVDEHINTGLTCPICSIVLPKDMQRDFERHVTLHFDEEGSVFEVV